MSIARRDLRSVRIFGSKFMCGKLRHELSMEPPIDLSRLFENYHAQGIDVFLIETSVEWETTADAMSFIAQAFAAFARDMTSTAIYLEPFKAGDRGWEGIKAELESLLKRYPNALIFFSSYELINWLANEPDPRA